MLYEKMLLTILLLNTALPGNPGRFTVLRPNNPLAGIPNGYPGWFTKLLPINALPGDPGW